ncbi:MAG: hypothetical protein Kow00121_38300 [Elainellaceae cyanobacterium]
MARIRLTEGNDNRIGTNQSDRIFALGGNDTIQGAAGALDEIFGGDGNDILFGGLINGPDGLNRLFGNDGNDILHGSTSFDSLFGGQGDDFLSGHAGNDFLVGDEFSQAGNDVLNGGAGNDILMGEGGNDLMFAGSGTDRLIGASSAGFGVREIDTLVGGAGTDTFVLGDGVKDFYNDSNNSNRGLGDYALIQGFNAAEDKIELTGSAGRFVLGSSPISGIQGTAIYLRTGNTNELISVVQNVSNLNLNSSTFTYL